MVINKLIAQGFDLRGKWSGDVKTLCPKCADSRKKSKDPSLSVNIDTGVWKCHNCGWTGSVNQYVRPEPRRQVENKAIFDFFEARGIGRSTVEYFRISEGEEWMPQDQQMHKVVCFNYYMEGELINIKFKTKDKKFKMVKDAQKIPFNIDAVKNAQYVIISEGEEEVMCWHQSNLKAISVPNGASKTNNNLDWLNPIYDYFADKIIYIATDNDEPGRKLRDDLMRRFAEHDVRIIDFPEGQKDANDCLLAYGQEFLTRLYSEARLAPMEDIGSVSEYEQIILSYMKDGYPVGATVGMVNTDKHHTWSRGELGVVSGIPGHGKSTWLDYMSIRLSLFQNWKFGMFAPENIPQLKLMRMAEQLLGKPLKAMSRPELQNAMDFLGQHYVFYNTEKIDDYSLTNLLNIGSRMVRRLGIDALILDPFNYIDMEGDEKDHTQKIGQLLRKLKLFAVKHDVLVVLVAHPRKMDKNGQQYNVPRMYDISGSHHFFNVPDWGIVIHRTYQDGINDPIQLHVQKHKYHFRGTIGTVDYFFDRSTGQYSEDGLYKSLYHAKLTEQTNAPNLFSPS